MTPATQKLVDVVETEAATGNKLVERYQFDTNWYDVPGKHWFVLEEDYDAALAQLAAERKRAEIVCVADLDLFAKLSYDWRTAPRLDMGCSIETLISLLSAERKRVDEAVAWLRKCKNYKLDPDVEMNIEDALTALTAKEGRP